MEALAAPEDVADLWRPLTGDDEYYRVQRLIEKASAMLRHATPTNPSLDDRIALWRATPDATSALDPDIVANVVATIVKRFVSNDSGAVSTTETVGPYAKSTSYALRGDKEVRGELQVTTNDLAALRPYQPKARIGSIRLSPALAPWPVGRYSGPGIVESFRITDSFFNPPVVEVPVPIYAPDRSQ